MLLGIIFVIKIVKGHDCLQKLGPPEFDNMGGKTLGLLLLMLKSYFAMGWNRLRHLNTLGDGCL